MIVLYVLYALVGVSIIIFIHESGHYLAAKKAGVRVEKFSLGFDPSFRGRPLRFFSFRAGETEYILGMILFGGYVKLAGEAIADPSKPAAPDELLSKSVGARSLVFAAGSIMNVLSAFVFFMIAFTMGVSFVAPIVGTVLPQTAAWDAGLRPGDKVVEIDGKEILDYTEMKIAVVLGKNGTPRDFRVERATAAGGKETIDLRILPRFDEEQGFSEIGVLPAYSDVLRAPVPGSAAEAAGLRAGDRIIGLEVAGHGLPPLPPTTLMGALDASLVLGSGKPIRLKLLRGAGNELMVELTPKKATGEKPRAQIGVQQGMGTIVAAIQTGSRAADRLKPGDQIRGAGGMPVHAIHWLQVLERWPQKDGQLELDVVSAEGTPRRVTVPWNDFLRWNLLGEIAWGGYDCEAISVQPGCPLERAGLREGDRLAGVGDQRVFSRKKIKDILAGQPPASTVLKVIRGKETYDLTVDRQALESSSGVEWSDVPPLAAVVQGGPADQAGIVPGSRFTRVGSKTIHSWEELTDAIGDATPGSALEIAWRGPDGTARSAAVTVGLLPPEPLGLAIDEEQTTVRAGILASFGLGLQRTVVTSKQIFLTLRSLIRREVSAKNLSGPVGITHLLTKVVEHGKLSTLIYFLALISINLGLFNLLPFPILDGGHLLFLAIEKVKGSPVDVRVQEWAMNIAFLLILVLAAFVTFHDLKRLLG